MIANLFNIAVLALLFFAGISLARRSGSALVMKFAHWTFLALLFVPLNALRKHFFEHSLASAGSAELGLVEGLFALGAAAAFLRWRKAGVRVGKAVVIILLPFAVFTVLQQLSLIADARLHRAAAVQSAPPASRLPVTHSARVLWLVFDEMDEELTFGNRPSSLRLPELDRLRAEAIYATSARAPAGYTQISMPALLSGDRVSKIGFPNSHQMTVTLAAGGRTVLLGGLPNVFAKARDRGFNVGVGGWYLPYCREFGRVLSACAWEPVQNFQSLTVLQSIPVLIRRTLDEIPAVRELPVLMANGLEKEQLRATYLRLRQNAMKFASDSTLGFVLLHWPIPHPPGIYDRARGRFNSDHSSNYIDNLALADLTLGELRRAMEHAGMWESTTVLLTADHPWRPGVWRHTYAWTHEEESFSGGLRSFVPFLLKMPRQKDAMTYGPGFNTIIASDLILAILDGKLLTAQDAREWLDRHRADQPAL